MDAVFIESPIFTEDVKRILSDEEYAALQANLVRRPARGKGKRGGVRIIYFHVPSRSEIRMILIYRKGIKDDLTSKEKSALRNLNREWLR